MVYKIKNHCFTKFHSCKSFRKSNRKNIFLQFFKYVLAITDEIMKLQKLYKSFQNLIIILYFLHQDFHLFLNIVFLENL